MSDQEILEQKIGKKVNQTPAVSVIIPAYNAAEFIVETLDSVLSQSYKNYEIILVNDGSPDTFELEKILEKYFDEIIYIKQKNGGTASARNTAIRNSRGEFLAFLDGDDIWFSEYLESQLDQLNVKKCDLIYCDAKLFGYVRDEQETFMEKSPSRGSVTAESLIGATCNVITSGTLAKREKVVAAGMFDETLPRIGMEDFDLWFRLAKSGAKLDYQTKVLLKYRVRPNSLSGSNVQRAERIIKCLQIISNKHKLSESEQTALQNQLKLAEAEFFIEKGKFDLTRENFAEARQNFAEANLYHRKIKLRILIWLLAVNPQLGLKLFRKLRPAEFLFIAPNKNE